MEIQGLLASYDVVEKGKEWQGKLTWGGLGRGVFNQVSNQVNSNWMDTELKSAIISKSTTVTQPDQIC